VAGPDSSSSPPAPPVLDGAQRRHLRGLAHPLKPIIFVGEGGLSDALIRALDEALASHELVEKCGCASPRIKKPRPWRSPKALAPPYVASSDIPSCSTALVQKTPRLVYRRALSGGATAGECLGQTLSLSGKCRTDRGQNLQTRHPAC